MAQELIPFCYNVGNHQEVKMKRHEFIEAIRPHVFIQKTTKQMAYSASLDFCRIMADIAKEGKNSFNLWASAGSMVAFQKVLPLTALQFNHTIYAMKGAIHMQLDDYVGLPKFHESSFGYDLQQRIYKPFGIEEQHIIYFDTSVGMEQALCLQETIDFNGGDTESVKEDTKLLKDSLKYYLYTKLPKQIEKAKSETTTIVAVIGIGLDGHLAFIEPASPLIKTQRPVGLAELTDVSRTQQVQLDKRFDTISKVPKYAITVTLKTILEADNIFVIVPYQAKAGILNLLFSSYHGSYGDIQDRIVASYLFRSDILPKTKFFFDYDSISKSEILQGLANTS
jgi:6-phosphogluconolactonase/glucosamine-6-phosphate isomerase/deaminase